MRPSYLIILVVLNFFWSGTLSSYKILETHLLPGDIVTLRYGISILCLTAAWPWLPGAAPRGWDLVKTCLMGLLAFCIGQRLQVWGTHLGTAGNSAVLMGLEPLISSVAAAVFLHEHIGPRRWIGFTLGIAGVVLLNSPWAPGFHWIGLTASVIFVVSFVGEAAYSVIGKPILPRAGLMKILAVALLAGSVVNVAIDGRHVLGVLPQLSWAQWLILLGLSVVCTVIGYGFWFVAIRETDVNVVALTVFLQPIFGVAIAVIWVGEPLHWGQCWGGLVIAIGLAIGLSRQIKLPRRKAADAPA